MDINVIIRDVVMVVIVPLLGILVRYLAAYLKQNTDNQQLKKYITLAENAVAQAVEYVAQTYVDALKNTGEFTPEAQAKAFETAKQRALEILGEDAVAMLNEIYGDFNTWLETKIEQHCRALKQENIAEPQQNSIGFEMQSEADDAEV